MKISIAMATYNGAKYLQEQLDSFVAQTRKPDELVVCDDCSVDETVAILHHFAETAPFEVRIFVNENNLGYGQNFGRALSLCRGDLIFLSDQDDVWLNQKIETIEKLAEEDKLTQIFMNDAQLVHHDLSPTGLTQQSQFKSGGVPDSCFVMGCCMTIRREFLRHLLPIPMEFTHDTWLSKIGEGLERRKIIPSVLQLYRRHGNNETFNITSQTQRLNKIDVSLYRLNKTFQRIRHYSQSNESIEIMNQTEAILKVLTKYLEKASDKYLIAQINEFKISQEGLQERIRIRSMPFFERIFCGWNFYSRGEYKKFSGFKSYVRDIFYEPFRKVSVIILADTNQKKTAS